MSNHFTADTNSQPTVTIEPGILLEDKWELIKQIGRGTFSEIYLARDIHHPDDIESLVAVKFQTSQIEGANVLRWESTVLRTLHQDLKSSHVVPKYHSYGTFQRKEYLIMELLKGEVMSQLRNRIRNPAQNPSGLVPIQIASYLTRQMLNCIRKLHEKGYVHRDIKPSNFIRKNSTSTQFLVIDFGLTKQYLDKDGNIKPRREKADFRGTTIYASPFVHDGEDQGPRDDVCSIIHVFFDLLAGKLPWSELAKTRDKAGVGNLKKRLLNHPKEFVSWIANAVHTAELYKNVSQTNFPSTAQEKCLEIIQLLRNLRYDDVPPYDDIEMLLYECVPQNLRQEVGNINYSTSCFTWKDPSMADRFQDCIISSPVSPAGPTDSNLSITPSNRAYQLLYSANSTNSLTPNMYAGSSSSGVTTGGSAMAFTLSDPTIVKLKNLTTRMKALVHKIPSLSASQPSTSSSNTSLCGLTIEDVYARSMRWKGMVHELLAIAKNKSEEDKIGLDLCELFYQVLASYHFFFEMNSAPAAIASIINSSGNGGNTNNSDGGKGCNWKEFEQVIETVGLFLNFYDRRRQVLGQLAVNNTGSVSTVNENSDQQQASDGKEAMDICSTEPGDQSEELGEEITRMNSRVSLNSAYQESLGEDQVQPSGAVMEQHSMTAEDAGVVQTSTTGILPEEPMEVDEEFVPHE